MKANKWLGLKNAQTKPTKSLQTICMPLMVISIQYVVIFGCTVPETFESVSSYMINVRVLNEKRIHNSKTNDHVKPDFNTDLKNPTVVKFPLYWSSAMTSHGNSL